MNLPLTGLTILEFSQYLSGPSAGLRLADMGARVIKIEQPVKGDACRRLAIKNLWVDDDSLLFHTINRNKESFSADLKDPDDFEAIKKLIARCDVLMHNFRPGVMERVGLDYASVQQIQPSVIYCSISGYGTGGPWKHKPGQDLLIQAMSGLAYATGNGGDYPMPLGLGIADYLCGNQSVQGILAALFRRKKTGNGAHIELSLMETSIDFQFEFFTTYFQSNRQHLRSEVNNGHSLLSAPYGIYQTADGFIAIAMMPLDKLNASIECKSLQEYGQADVFVKRDEIKTLLKQHFVCQTNDHWMKRLHAHDLWAMPVLNWKELRNTKAYKALNMEQELHHGEKRIITSRCPIKFNKKYFFSGKPAPALGADTERISKELTTQALCKF